MAIPKSLRRVMGAQQYGTTRHSQQNFLNRHVRALMRAQAPHTPVDGVTYRTSRASGRVRPVKPKRRESA